MIINISPTSNIPSNLYVALHCLVEPVCSSSRTLVRTMNSSLSPARIPSFIDAFGCLLDRVGWVSSFSAPQFSSLTAALGGPSHSWNFYSKYLYTSSVWTYGNWVFSHFKLYCFFLKISTVCLLGFLYMIRVILMITHILIASYQRVNFHRT